MLEGQRSLRQVPMQRDGGAAGTLRDCAVSLCHTACGHQGSPTSLMAAGRRRTAADIPGAGPAAGGSALGRLCGGVQGAPVLSLNRRT